MTANVAVVILTLNEALNLPHAVNSVRGWAREVFVLDSFSTDRTAEIAESLDCTVVQHRFENFGRQRNHALEALPIQSEWVLFLDADEWLPEALKSEISETLAANPTENGFLMSRRFLWMGKWVRRGYYPTWILRLFRTGTARCEEREVNEHLVVTGKIGRLREDFMHEDHNGIVRWVAKHNDYALKEALEQLRQDADGKITESLFGEPAERVRWIRHRIWNRLPLLARPFLYFGYRYGVRGGFLDGKEALVYHLLQALYFPLLIDVNLLELRAAKDRET